MSVCVSVLFMCVCAIHVCVLVCVYVSVFMCVDVWEFMLMYLSVYELTDHILVDPGILSSQNCVSSFIKNSSLEALMINLGIVSLSTNTEIESAKCMTLFRCLRFAGFITLLLLAYITNSAGFISLILLVLYH